MPSMPYSLPFSWVQLTLSISQAHFCINIIIITSSINFQYSLRILCLARNHTHTFKRESHHLSWRAPDLSKTI